MAQDPTGALVTRPPVGTRRRILTGVAGAFAAVAIPGTGRSADIYKPFKGQKIVVSFPGPHPHYDAAQHLFGDFTAETGILVERDRTPYLDMRERQLRELVKPQGGYDVVTYLIAWKNEYVERGLLRSLDGWLAGGALHRTDYDIDDLVGSYVDAIGRAGGRRADAAVKPPIFGIPYGAETSVLGYRRDVLQDCGLGIPTTYDELLRACEVVRDRARIGGVASRSQRGH